LLGRRREKSGQASLGIDATIAAWEPVELLDAPVGARDVHEKNNNDEARRDNAAKRNRIDFIIREK